MGDGRRPTMRDVAARAGVSFKTVSRVVNDEPGVSPALIERVRQAVDELGFRPNVGARVLRRADARTASIGLLLDDVADPFSRDGPARGAGRRRGARGWRCSPRASTATPGASGRWSRPSPPAAPTA